MNTVRNSFLTAKGSKNSYLTTFVYNNLKYVNTNEWNRVRFPNFSINWGKWTVIHSFNLRYSTMGQTKSVRQESLLFFCRLKSIYNCVHSWVIDVLKLFIFNEHELQAPWSLVKNCSFSKRKSAPESARWALSDKGSARKTLKKGRTLLFNWGASIGKELAKCHTQLKWPIFGWTLFGRPFVWAAFCLGGPKYGR